MSTTWDSAVPPDLPPITPAGWLRVSARAVCLAVVVFGGLAILLLIRLVERPLSGLNRPVTPYVTQGVCRLSLWIMGLDYRTEGQPMTKRGAVVANHSSWLDIFALNAAKRIYFVSKSEVAGWPGIGWLARATGTLFVTRDRRRAAGDVAALRDRIALGQTLVFFPEGTSTDGRQVLAFKPTLLAPFVGRDLAIQPVTLRYEAPSGADPACYGWWGDMEFGAHLLTTLALPRQGRVVVQYHEPVALAGLDDRKALARHLEETVRSGL